MILGPILNQRTTPTQKLTFDRTERKVKTMNEGVQYNLDTIDDAIRGDNPDQARIAETGLAWLRMLLNKNSDYGGSVWRQPALSTATPAEAILVRMSDKIERLKTLLASREPPSVNESIEDTMRDLGAYCLLWLARPEEDSQDQSE